MSSSRNEGSSNLQQQSESSKTQSPQPIATSTSTSSSSSPPLPSPTSTSKSTTAAWTSEELLDDSPGSRGNINPQNKIMKDRDDHNQVGDAGIGSSNSISSSKMNSNPSPSRQDSIQKITPSAAAAAATPSPLSIQPQPSSSTATSTSPSPPQPIYTPIINSRTHNHPTGSVHRARTSPQLSSTSLSSDSDLNQALSTSSSSPMLLPQDAGIPSSSPSSAMRYVGSAASHGRGKSSTGTGTSTSKRSSLGYGFAIPDLPPSSDMGSQQRDRSSSRDSFSGESTDEEGEKEGLHRRDDAEYPTVWFES